MTHRSDEGTDPTESPTYDAASLTDRPSDEEVEQIEAERRERLADENRPENASVDNTDRDFDPVEGRFTDSPPDPDVGPFMDPQEEDPTNG